MVLSRLGTLPSRTPSRELLAPQPVVRLNRRYVLPDPLSFWDPRNSVQQWYFVQSGADLHWWEGGSASSESAKHGAPRRPTGLAVKGTSTLRLPLVARFPSTYTYDLGGHAMNIVYPEPQKTVTGCDEWCIPLHLVEKAVAGKKFADGFSVWDFMVMGRVEDEQGSIVLYKHCDTRRYINVDDAGHAYRYSPGRPQSGRRGDYLPLRTLSEAIAHLGTDASESVVPPLRYWGHVRTL